MNTVRACLTFLSLLLTIGCNSAMPGSQRTTQPPPGGSSSGSSVAISSVSPTSVMAGSQDFTLTIVGTGFPASPAYRKDHPGVFWQASGTQSGVYLPIDISQCDATHVIATVPAALVQNAGTFTLQVQIYYFANDTPKSVSNLVNFVVN